MKAELGNLERIRRILKIVGYVASEEGFFCQPQVINGASDLLVDIFGDNGKHARVAVGVAELPENVPVEIELVLEIKNTKRKRKLDQDRISDHHFEFDLDGSLSSVKFADEL